MRFQFKVGAIVLAASILCSAPIIAFHFKPKLKVTYRQQATLQHEDSPLHDAIDKNMDVSGVAALIDKNPSIINLRQGGTTPLHEAVAAERLDLVKLFLKRGAQVDAKIKGEYDDVGSGDTSLITAVRFQNVEIAKALIDAGASIDIKTKDGRSLRQIADDKKDSAMRSLLDSEHRERSENSKLRNGS